MGIKFEEVLDRLEKAHRKIGETNVAVNVITDQRNQLAKELAAVKDQLSEQQAGTANAIRSLSKLHADASALWRLHNEDRSITSTELNKILDPLRDTLAKVAANYDILPF